MQAKNREIRVSNKPAIMYTKCTADILWWLEFLWRTVQKKSRLKSLVMKLRDRVATLQLNVEQLKIDKEALKYVWCNVY